MKLVLLYEVAHIHRGFDPEDDEDEDYDFVLNLRRGADMSWEGIGLSITLNDREVIDGWGQIMRIGADISDHAGAYAVLRHKDGSPGVFALWSRSLTRRVPPWAKKNGWYAEPPPRGLPSSKMERHWSSIFSPMSRLHISLQRALTQIEATNLFVASQMPDLDGVWWDDHFDPSDLSAPRGVILPHAFDRWEVV